MKVLWLPLAEQTYYNILEYLHETWSIEVVKKFINDVEQIIILLQKNPELFNWWDAEKNYKIGHINKHISFFYSFDEKNLYIHLFWNNHRNPSILKKFL